MGYIEALKHAHSCTVLFTLEFSKLLEAHFCEGRDGWKKRDRSRISELKHRGRDPI